MSARVLCVHSTGLGPGMWTKLRQLAIPQSASVLIPPNCGYPPAQLLAKPARCSAAYELANLNRVLDAAGVDEESGVHVVAHSYGGLLALLLAASTPRVRSLVLLEPVVFGALMRVKAAQPAAVQDELSMFEHPSWADPEQGGKAAWLKKFVDYWGGAGAWDRMPQGAQKVQGQLGWKVFQEVMNVSLSPPFEELAVKIPVTIQHGGKSPASVAAMVQGLHRVMPHAELVFLPEAGHSAPLSHAAALAPHLKAHFDRVSLLRP